MTDINDPLWAHFKPLWLDFEKAGEGVLVAGGYGLFLKQQWLLVSDAQPVVVPFERWPDAAPRATADLDLVVSLDLISDETANRQLFEALEQHGFKVSEKPHGKRWKFFKEIGDDRHIIVELHAPKPEGALENLKANRFAVKFWATTSNKQLNFLQHIVSELKVGGRAAVVLPDNVLFFDRKEASEKPWTNDLWIYDLRTNQHFTLKTNPLATKDLTDFVDCYLGRDARPRASADAGKATKTGKTDDRAGRPYHGKRKETDRFKKFTYGEIVARDKANLDIFWLKGESLEDTENLPPPAELAAEIVESLEAALEEFKGVEEALQNGAAE